MIIPEKINHDLKPYLGPGFGEEVYIRLVLYNNLKAKNERLREACDAALEWFAQYPFNNAQFERQTANEMYDNLQAVLDEVEDSDV